eukprot:gene3054-8143_t
MFLVGHRDPTQTFSKRHAIITTTFWSPGGLEIGGRWSLDGGSKGKGKGSKGSKDGGRKGVPEDITKTIYMLPGDALAIWDYCAKDCTHSVPATLTREGVRCGLVLRVIELNAPEITEQEIEAMHL